MAHLYNLRQQPRYRERRLHYVKTRPTAVAIGERRCPDPQGQPGYLRVDTVHQETLLALPNPAQYLRPGLTPAVLQRIAAARSDTEAAERMQQAKRRLFAPLRPPAGGPWK